MSVITDHINLVKYHKRGIDLLKTAKKAKLTGTSMCSRLGGDVIQRPYVWAAASAAANYHSPLTHSPINHSSENTAPHNPKYC